MSIVMTQQWLLEIFKALGDENRLQMLQWLAESECNPSTLAEKLSLTEPTISHHLAKLREARLVTLRMEGNNHFYRANASTLTLFKNAVQSVEKIPASHPVETDRRWLDLLPDTFSDDERKQLGDMTFNGILKRIPSKQAKLGLVLRWIATKFEADRLYTEPEVNTIIKTVFPSDHTTLRRDLVDYGFLRRERGGGKYWLTPHDEQTPAAVTSDTADDNIADDD